MNDIGIVACIATKDLATPPEDQVGCTHGNCEVCDAQIWVSQKKRGFLENFPNSLLMCMHCAVITAEIVTKAGEKTKVINMGKA